MFKIIHTSDWHLGKKLFKIDRLDEQVFFLDWLVNYIKEHEINLLLIAGDIYDSPTPSNEAQKTFYDFIYKLGKIPNFQTVLITGNHDSSSQFEIPKEFFKEHNCFIYSRFAQDNQENEHIIDYQDKKIGIKLLPYFRNFELVNHLKKSEMEMEDFFKEFFNSWATETPDYKILMSHHSFGKFAASGSEHAIHLSGIDSFPLNWVSDAFDYIALGHIHKKQTLNQSPCIIYPGSPLPLRFSEHNHKYISQVTITEDEIKQEDIRVPLKKLLIQLHTNLHDYEEDINSLLKKSANQDQNYLLEVKIDYHQAQTGVADHIRELLNDSKIELISYLPMIQSQTDKNIDYNEINQLDLSQLFSKYYAYKYDTEEIPEEILSSFNKLLTEVRHEDT